MGKPAQTALSADGPAGGIDSSRLLGPQDDLRPSIYGSYFLDKVPFLLGPQRTLLLGLSLTASPLTHEEVDSEGSLESEMETLTQVTEILLHLLDCQSPGESRPTAPQYALVT